MKGFFVTNMKLDIGTAWLTQYDVMWLDAPCALVDDCWKVPCSQSMKLNLLNECKNAKGKPDAVYEVTSD